MKKFILAALMVVLSAVSVQAFEIGVFTNRGITSTQSYTLLSAVTSTGTGTWAPVGHIQAPMYRHLCTAIWSGTTPSTITFAVIVGENPSGVSGTITKIMDSSPWVFGFYAPEVSYIQGEQLSKTGGDATTKLSLTCTSGGI